ncbi:hypothetical protein V5799_012439 [Amblyomma americanum]|uniref:Uncharacterized protein n=1 Tax=Amblyomma americanum TaxID=6943 RepID=A0AAQ4EE64_AMBAM
MLGIRKPEIIVAPDTLYIEALKTAALTIRPGIDVATLTEHLKSMVVYARELRYLDDYLYVGPVEERRVTIGDLEKNFSNIPLATLLNKELKTLNVSLGEDDIVELRPYTFYKRLSESLQNFDP